MKSDPSEVLDQNLTEFVDTFAEAWTRMGATRLEGRALGLMLIMDEPHLSSGRIGALLQASAGAVSVAMRALVSHGFVQRKTLPSDRNHYFRVEDDVWGRFLELERDYVPLAIQAAKLGLDALPEQAETPRRRMTIALDYLTWLRTQQAELLRNWQAYRDRETDAAPQAAAKEDKQ